MPRFTGTFDADGQSSPEVLLKPGQHYYLSLAVDPSLTGKVQLLQRELSTAKYEVLQTYTDAQAGTEYINTTGKDVAVKLMCVDLDAGEPETVDYVLQSLISTGRRFLVDHRPKVGATAGWVINAANNVGLVATLPAGETSSTLVIPLDSMEIGDRITGFYPVGQVESAGNTAALTINLRSITAAAADVVDASVATTGAVSLTADTLLGRIGALALDNLDVRIADGTSYYFLITGTTAASTDVALQGVMVQVVRNSNDKLNGD
jgi:hypothetical protein